MPFPVLIGLLAGSLLLPAATAELTPVPDPAPIPDPTSDPARHFDARIAPLLARHCLECHDSISRQGHLDLSRRDESLLERRGAAPIVPGHPARSLVWEVVESGEMPPDNRTPLTPEEKRLLHDWIEAGAVWSADSIDPLAHTRDQRAAAEWVRRLTLDEYIATVRDLLGVDIAGEARLRLPPDLRADGFRNTAYNLVVDLAHIEAYADLAGRIVARLDVPAFTRRFVACTTPEDACFRELIAAIGYRLFRGPLDDRETRSFLTVTAAVLEEGGDFTEATGYLLEAMLQAPRFLYRIETQSGDGQRRPLDPYELASRLSYLVWGAPPDDALLDDARHGHLAAPGTLDAQLDRLLDDPRAIDRSLTFFSEWLDLDRLQALRPNPQKFPRWSERLAADMRDETLAFVRDAVWNHRRPLAELMNAQFTFATPRLARHYGFPLPEGTLGSTPDTPGLLALYTFESGDGDVIPDVSGSTPPLDLRIADTAAVAWTGDGLVLHAAARIASMTPATRLIDAVKASGALTIEAWITPANTSQAGPARIVTLSSGSSLRNVTLGQDADRFDVRLRTRSTNPNGIPGLQGAPGGTTPELTCVLYTREASGEARLYLNGQPAGSATAPGDLANWDASFHLLLGNETSHDRPWLGTLHRVALLDRALSDSEIRARAPAMARYDLSAVPARGGLLTQGSTLTVGGDEASMVTRGLFILHDFLHSAVGSAPPCADTTPVPIQPGLSQRAIALGRLANPSCGGCHSRFEPLAFALEKFDGVGAFHEQDELGNPLREDGAIRLPGSDRELAYASAAGFMDLLAASDRVRMTFTRKLAQFALGRPMVESDGPALDAIHRQALGTDGGTYHALLAAIVRSDLFQTVRTEPSTPIPQ
ncbi:MAG: DUF1592 domain-containing protein [Verrucomicrobiae bacterium]|nr:DUF1592 domain-containing protein [Verrucomicrobiae bacterium]